MRVLSPAILAALAPLAAAAEDVVGPEAVFAAGDLGQCIVRPWDGAFGDCLATLGAPEAAVAFAERLLADPAVGTAGVLTGFTEYGIVDLAEVEFPALANANSRILLVNANLPVIAPETLGIGQPPTRAAAAILAAHPGAMAAGPMTFAAHRDLPDGTQRFVLTDRITDGCRACEVLAVSVAHVDFLDGALTGLAAVDWVAPAIALDPEAARDAIAAGDAAVLQYRLMLAGYDVGGADGITGPRTLTALDDFLADHCLPSRRDEPEVREAAIAVIAGLNETACDEAQTE